MYRTARLFAVAAFLFAASSQARAEGPDPAITGMAATHGWKYRAPLATYHVSVIVQNLGDQDFRARKGEAFVNIWARERVTTGRASTERLIARIPLTHLAAEEEQELSTQFFPLVDAQASVHYTFRAAISYESGGQRVLETTKSDANLTNNAWPR